MKRLLLYLSVIPGLGWLNVLYNIWYRISLKVGLRRLFFRQRELPHTSDFFSAGILRQGYPSQWREDLINEADNIVSGNLRYFSKHRLAVGNPPDWFLNPFNGAHYPETRNHWTKIQEFNKETGDIKSIWEASRLEWVVTLARAFSVTGESRYLGTVNYWLKDWALKNPLNTGPNWRCGQEASVRIFNLAIAAEIVEPSESLRDLVYAHLERVSGNICYAVSQDNNHGTSEAAGLFIGGSWLVSADSDRYPRAADYSAQGRKWLENRVEKLVAEDGGFSQHSVNYHRVLIDTLAFAEHFRKKFAQKPFSPLFYERAKAAVNWLYQLTDEISGGAPNLGANDGSLLNHLHRVSYKDFRPSLQLASAIFARTRLFDPGDADEPVYWFNEAGNDLIIAGPPKENRVFDSGYVVLRNKDSWCLLRVPQFRFRPLHNDVFHFDLWHKSINVLCDAGTYSYNPSDKSSGFNLKSVHSHNTVAFDDHEQMPELSRFLPGKWIKPDNTGGIKENEKGEISWEGRYSDSYSDRHFRKISVLNNSWSIEDRLSGEFKKASIGFNINTTDCHISGREISTPSGIIITPEDTMISLRETVISEYYNETKVVQRLVIDVKQPGVYTTLIRLNP